MGAAARRQDAVKVFLTGGTGLVGRHVIVALRARGDRVRGLARTAAAAAQLASLGAEPVEGDLTAASRLESTLAGCDAVVHAAAMVLSGKSWPTWHATNVLGTELVARAAARQRARLVYLSSVAVYGRQTTYDGGPGSVDEDFGLARPVSARDLYARSKRDAELAVWRVAGETGLSAVALRPCVVYGEGDRHFAPRVAWALRRGLAPVVGRGDNQLSVVYAGNVAAAVLAALERRDVDGPFNVTNDGGVTQRGFLEHFAAGLGISARFHRIPTGLARSAAGLWDAACRLLPRQVRLMRLGTTVTWMVSENPYTSARAERQLQWRPVLAPGEAVERTGRSFRERRDPP
jgi:nucleoside-diphosphate-sugar epimerase